MTTLDVEPFVLRGGESWRSPWSAYRWLRDNEPVHRVDHDSLGRFWVLSRFTDVIDAARDTATFSSAQGLTPGPDSELFAFGSELIERRRVEPGDDLVSLLVQAGEGAVSAGWIVGFVFTMVTGGNDTTTGLLGGAAAPLTERPDQRRLLLDDPALIPGAVEEFLRLTSPVQNLARTTTVDVTLHDTTVPAGDKVMLLYGSANRDERVFGPDAGDLDVCRRIERMVSFGYGAHHCLGAAAARLQATVVITELLARFPDFAVDADAGRFASGPYVRRYETLPFSALG